LNAKVFEVTGYQNWKRHKCPQRRRRRREEFHPSEDHAASGWKKYIVN